MRREIESYYIWIENDLKFSAICKFIKKDLLLFSTSKPLVKYFKQKDANTLAGDEPTVVITLKKMINAMEIVEKLYQDVEEIVFNPEKYTAEIIYMLLNRLGDMSKIIQLLSEISADVPEILRPHIEKLLPIISLAVQKLGDTIPYRPEAAAGVMLGEAVGMLPLETTTENQSLENLSRILNQLPDYFKELEQFISGETSGIEKTASEAKIASMQSNFEKHIVEGGFLSNVEILKDLLVLSKSVVNAAAFPTKDIYKKAKAELDKIKYQILPQLIQEVEVVEESIGLEPGKLTNTILEKMSIFYSQLANKVKYIENFSSGIDTVVDRLDSNPARIALGLLGAQTKLNYPGKPVITDPNLTLLIDDTFIDTIRSHQINRLNETLYAEDVLSAEEAKKAAESFFGTIDNFFYSPRLSYELTDVQKEQLSEHYKKFQSHFAKQYPVEDKLIVEALTQKQATLTEINQFEAFSSCKDAALASINQSIIDAEFKSELIRQRIEADLYPNNHLNTSATPFQSLKYPAEENNHKKLIVVANQITQLERAQQGVNTFFDCVKRLVHHPLEASLAEKEILRIAYKKFQSQLLTIGKQYSEINEKLVSSLNPDSNAALNIQQLNGLEEKIKKHLETTIASLEMDKKKFLILEPKQKTKLKPIGSEVGKKTIFQLLCEQKLSEKLETFLEDTFLQYLKSNLSEPVFKALCIEGEFRPPFQDTHKDPAEVEMYKKFINSIYYMKKGFNQLEKIQEIPEIFSVVNLNLPKLVPLSNIYSGMNYLAQVGGNPAIKQISQQCLDLLAPLKSIPMFGSYFQPTIKKEIPKKDIIEAWKEQQEIVSTILSSKFRTQELRKDLSDTSKAVQVEEQPNYLQSLASVLYQIPEILKGDNPNTLQNKANIQAFIDSLSEFTYSPSAETVQKILKVQSKLQAQITEMASVGKALTMRNLITIKSEFSRILLETTDAVEFNLGLKPGSYSDVASKSFDKFYNALIENLPIEKKEGLELLLDVSTIERRLQSERNHKQEITADATEEIVREKIFGFKTKYKFTHCQAFIKLQKLLAEGFTDIQPIKDAYKIISPLLAGKKGIRPAAYHDYLISVSELKSSTPKNIVSAVGSLVSCIPGFSKFSNFAGLSSAVRFLSNTAAKISSYITGPSELETYIREVLDNSTEESEELEKTFNNSCFGKIYELSLNNFTEMSDWDEFLQYYAELQPFLFKIDCTFDDSFFLRGLRTQIDFQDAAKKILANEGKLLELIEGYSKTKEINMQKCEERIQYFEALLEKQQLEIKPEKIKAFKEQVVSNYLSTVLNPIYGAHNAVHYLQVMKDSLTTQIADTLEKIQLTEGMEVKIIIGEIDKILPSIKQQCQEAFKNAIYDKHIKQIIAQLPENNLGIYQTFYNLRVRKAFDAHKDRILALPADKEIGETIGSALLKITPEILKGQIEFLKNYSELNMMLVETEKLIAIEKEAEKPQDNPCRKEKIIKLTELQLSGTQDIDLKPQLVVDHKEKLESLRLYDELISRYDVLESLKHKLYPHVLIEELQTILGNIEKIPEERLKLVKEKLETLGVNARAFNMEFCMTKINAAIKQQLQKELGPYGSVFFEKISNRIMTEVPSEIVDLSIDEIDSARISSIVEKATAKIYEDQDFKPIKEVYKKLNDSIGIINTEIESEELLLKIEPHSKSLREKKIAVLTSFEVELSNTENVQSLEQCQKLIERTKQFMEILKIHDWLIKMHNIVVGSESYSREEKNEKISTLEQMQIMLAPAETNSHFSKGLERVQDEFKKEECQGVLFNNIGWPLFCVLKFIQCILSCLSVISSFAASLLTLCENKLSTIHKEEEMRSEFNKITQILNKKESIGAEEETVAASGFDPLHLKV